MNRSKSMIVSCMSLILFSGCATLPTGPGVRVLPGDGKPFEQFQNDDAICRQWAGQQIGISPQETANRNATTGAAVGTILGAGVGALFGAAAGDPAAGAAIGAGSGLLLGTATGADAGYAYGWEAQRRYDNAYVQCMYAKGNLVPGVASGHRYSRRVMPPPPDYDRIPPDYRP